jgi:hypothetical protein
MVTSGESAFHKIDIHLLGLSARLLVRHMYKSRDFLSVRHGVGRPKTRISTTCWNFDPLDSESRYSSTVKSKSLTWQDFDRTCPFIFQLI